MQHVYLDNAATTQLRPRVLERMQSVLEQSYGNPSSTHAFGRSAKSAIEKARKTVAAYLNAQPSEIIFTSGGTEADNMILRSAVRDLGVKTIITTTIEHHAVLHTAEALKNEYGVSLQFVDLDPAGNPEMQHLENLLEAAPPGVLVSLMHVNNEIGNITDMNLLSELCSKYDCYLHSDTVQSVGHYPWDLQKTKVDFLTAAAHKFHGPKGVGFAYIRKQTGLKPLILGGSQERGYRAGTESLHNIVGLEEAMIAAYENMEEERAYVGGLKSYFIDKLTGALPGVSFNGYSGEPGKSTYTLVNVCLPFSEEKSPMLLFHLDLKGIACSRGSACQSGSNDGSHVLSAILAEAELKKPSIRFSFSIFNTREEIDYVVEVLKEFALD